MNLGNPIEYTIRELAETVIEMTSSRSKLEFKPLPSDDPIQRCPDISLATKALEWEPGITLRQGLVNTIDYFDVLLKAGDT